MKKTLHLVLMATLIAIAINAGIALRESMPVTKISYIELGTGTQSELVIHSPDFVPFYNSDGTSYLCLYSNRSNPSGPLVAFSSDMNPFDNTLLISSKKVKVVSVDNVFIRTLKDAKKRS